jgi:hypothetical protein
MAALVRRVHISLVQRKARLAEQRRRRCDLQVSVSVGVIFHDTRTPLMVWFEMVWLMMVQE